jgi:putative colanic acid biosynthesis acetyltransferase WcaF
MKFYQQKSIYDSPWSFQEKIKMFFWDYLWALFCSWTPKPLNGWRLFWLRLFGATLHGKPFVHQRARIQIPWNLTMHDRACIGDRANIYSLGPVELGVTIGEDCIIGACSVVTKDMPVGMICCGNPCRVVRARYPEKTSGV